MIKKAFDKVKTAVLGLALAAAASCGVAQAQVVGTNLSTYYLPNYSTNITFNCLTNTDVMPVGMGTNLSQQLVEANPRFGLAFEWKFYVTNSANRSNQVATIRFTTDGTNSSTGVAPIVITVPSNGGTNVFQTNWTSSIWQGYTAAFVDAVTNTDAGTTNQTHYQYIRLSRPRIPSSTSFYPNWP